MLERKISLKKIEILTLPLIYRGVEKEKKQEKCMVLYLKRIVKFNSLEEYRLLYVSSTKRFAVLLCILRNAPDVNDWFLQAQVTTRNFIPEIQTEYIALLF